MKIISASVLALLLSAQVYAFPIPTARTQRVIGEDAQEIFDNLTTFHVQRTSKLRISFATYDRTHSEALAVPAQECSGAMIKTGIFRPTLFSMYDKATCRTEGGEAVCDLSISEDRVRQVKKKSDAQEGGLASCVDLKTDHCIAGYGKSPEESCSADE